MKILVTGAAGFIAGYVVAELLRHGHHVVGIDNFSKYGPVAKAHDSHPNYRFVFGDCKDVALMTELASDCDQIVAGAAMIGGISYFHQYAYDLIAENERITASTFDAAIAANKAGRLAKINVLSSSMVFESAVTFPTPETEITQSAAAGQQLRLSEAGGGVFREGGAPAVRPALHHRAALQLRRHRRGQGAGRCRDPERQRQAQHVATCCPTLPRRC